MSVEDAERDRIHAEAMKVLQAERETLMAAKRDGGGQLLVHTGDGKGKSTAGFGMVARALGWKMKVGVVQYIKGKWITGERQFFARFPDQVTYKVMGEGFTWDTQDRARDVAAAEAAWAQSVEMIQDPAIDFVLLDELNIALRYDYLDIDVVCAGLQARPPGKHVCVTGRNAKPQLIAIADLVTEMTLVKHPFETGIKAQRGIDFLSVFATRRGALAAGLAVGLGAAAPVPDSAAEPRRVVSLNPCLDTMLAYLADRGQIAALSHYARQPHGSTVAQIARTLPFTYESAEEIIVLRPDLVLTARHSSPATRAALARLGVRTELFGVPDTIADSLDQVRRVARLVHRAARGDALIARIQAAIAASAPPPGSRRLTALIYQPNGFAAGHGTLVDAMMSRAGFDNAAQRYGLRQWGNVPLEKLIADPPDVLLAGTLEAGAPTWADRVVSHPALRHMTTRMHRASFPQQLLYCGGPVLISTAAALAKAHREALAA